MPHAFHFIRQSLRTIFISSSIVMGQLLLVTSARAPRELITPSFLNSLNSISAILFLTLLWAVFTVIDAADQAQGQGQAFILVGGGGVRQRDFELEKSLLDGEHHSGVLEAQDNEDQGDEDSGVIFERTWVEVVLNGLMVVMWAVYASDFRLVVTTYAASMRSVILPITYILALSSLIALQAQLILTIVHHAISAPPRSNRYDCPRVRVGVASWAFWNGRTGWWLVEEKGGVRLALGRDERV